MRGSRNLVSWLLAGGAAYYLFYLPEKQRMLEIQVRVWGMAAAPWGAPSPAAPMYVYVPAMSLSACLLEASSDGSSGTPPCILSVQPVPAELQHMCCPLCATAQVERERAKQRAVELGLEEVDRVRPMPDPQDTGLIKGRAAVARAQAAAAAAAAAAAGEAAPPPASVAGGSGSSSTAD